MSGFKDKVDSKKSSVKIKRNSSSLHDGESDKEVTDYEEEEDFDEEDDGEDEEMATSSHKAKLLVTGIAGVAIVLVLCVSFSFITDKLGKDKDVEPPQEPQQTVVADVGTTQQEPNQTTQDESKMVDVGTDTEPYDSDLVKSQVEPVWIYKEAKDVKDFCNYEKHRSVMGNGLELYWLDCTYKEMPYRIQIMYTTYKMLDAKGIVPVIMEQVTTEDGVKVITNMVVDTDYLKRLKK